MAVWGFPSAVVFVVAVALASGRPRVSGVILVAGFAVALLWMRVAS